MATERPSLVDDRFLCRLTPVNDRYETRRWRKKKPKSEWQPIENARGLFNRIHQGAFECSEKRRSPGGKIDDDMMEPDSKRIVRQWNREIEEEIRRRDARRDDGPWRIIVWVALAVLWFVALFAVLGLFERALR